MDDILTSTIAYRSNLQPVNATAIIADRIFLKHVHDPFALETLKKSVGGVLTSLQQKEFDAASMHCVYAFKDDYPFGTVIGENGKEQVVCKCLNTKCRLFGQCRPDFSAEELSVLAENEAAKQETLKFEIVCEDAGTEKGQPDLSSDAVAAAQVFDSAKQSAEQSAAQLPEEPDTSESISQSDIVPNDMRNIVTEPGADKECSDLPIASFESFKPVEQSEVISAPVRQRIIVNAGPGTGKTYTLIEKIKWMLNNEAVEADNIMVLCFSRSAVEVIRSRLQEAADNDALPMEWLHVDVRTFDSFATYMIAWIMENEPTLLPENYILESQGYDDRIRTATDILNREKDMLSEYEHVIIDEVQDLVGARAELVLTMLASLPEECGFTLLGDSCQALYDYMSKDDPGVMSSGQFYQSLFSNYRGARFVSLEHNYRQAGKFAEITVPYRQAIISGQASQMVQEAATLQDSLKFMEAKIQHFTNADANIYLKKGSLGILTRTNGQALQVSSWLRAENVKHVLQHSSASPELASWIGRVFRAVNGDTITENAFQRAFEALYPHSAVSCSQYWSALTDAQIERDRRYYEKELLLRGLLEKARNPLLYADPAEQTSRITVSNIHRAKGKEFDSVLVLDDVISAMADEENTDELEHRVCYVALTRARKQIERVELKTQYIYIMKDGSRRCFKRGGWKNSKYLSHFEVGIPGDFDMRSFATDTQTQEYILSNLHIGDRLKLVKCPEGTRGYVVYQIVPEEDEKRVLGFTTQKFAGNMESAIQTVFKNFHSINYKYFPDRFADVYLDSLTTCISSHSAGIAGAESYGGMFMWTGLSITGFAQMEKDKY